METKFLLYGATGFLGQYIASQAKYQGLQPILAGRNEEKLKTLANGLGLEYRVIDLKDTQSIDRAMEDVSTLFSCAGPFIHTYKPLVEACIRNGKNYLDITGELPVFEGVYSYDTQAKEKGVMLMPGIGFDVVPTDCLAVHLKNRLPSATHLTLAFYGQGPAGLPPGTQRTMIEMIPYGDWDRANGELQKRVGGLKTRNFDFGDGEVSATQITWGDIFTGYLSTAIPNIENYAVLPPDMKKQAAIVGRFRFFFKLGFVQKMLKKGVQPGPTNESINQTSTSVWGEVIDSKGQKAVSILHGPEAGVVWTVESSLAVLKHVLVGNIVPGYQTPAKAYGADLVLSSGQVTRIDVN